MAKKSKVLLPALASVVSSAIAVSILFWWVDRVAAVNQQIIMQNPGLDQVPAGARNQNKQINIGAFFTAFAPPFDSSLTGRWPNFRGVNHDNIAADGVKLADTWGDAGPPVLWRQPLGEGHSGPVIYDGQVFILDYLEKEKAEALRSFALVSGKELWRRWYHIDIKRNHGRSRTTPAVSDDHVVTIGPLGHVMGVDRKNGDLRWTIDLVKDFKTVIPQWYTGQCPFIEQGVVILAPAGPHHLIIGVDALTGQLLWSTPNPQKFKMSHASVMPMTIGGKKMYVYAAIGGIVGIAADGDAVGKILWQSREWSPSVVAPSPVQISPSQIYLTAGYGSGSTTVQVLPDKEGYKLTWGKKYKPREAFSLEQQSAILYQNTLLGIMSKDAGAARMQLVGVNPENIAQVQVASGATLRFGLCPFMVADDKIYVLDDTGTLTMLKMENKTFKVLGQHKIFSGSDPWGPLALADGLMVLRDSTSLACVDLSRQKKGAGVKK